MVTHPPPTDVPVLIAGGGIVGLAASLFLTGHGIPSLLVERHPGTSILPRARGFNLRTMELFRELGLEEAVREAGAELAPSFGIFAGETLADVIGPLPRGAKPTFPFGAATAAISPTNGSRCPQDRAEPVLLAAARQRGGDLRFNTELVGFMQDDAGVTATIIERTSGTTQTIRAAYLIAADGARSPIRSALGIPLSGRGALGHHLNIYFRADLRDLVAGREFSLCAIVQPGLRGLFASINNTDRWVFHLAYDPARGESPDDFPPARCIELVRQAIGLPDLAIDILSSGPWEEAVLVADDFRRGRVFLAGDAAHQMPPWGGHGANTGIQDAHNLAWKLAAVLKDQAAPALFDTYQAERHPIDRACAEASGQISDQGGLAAAVRPNLTTPPTLPAALNPALTIGYQYHSAAILDDGTPPLPPDQPALDGRPGTRAPHLWVERDGARHSTLDLFGQQFVLLAGPEGGTWCAAAQTIAARTDLPLIAYRLGPTGDLLDPESQWPTIAGIATDGALLIRPDGFVAWRAQTTTADPERALTQTLDHLLARSPTFTALTPDLPAN